MLDFIKNIIIIPVILITIISLIISIVSYNRKDTPIANIVGEDGEIVKFNTEIKRYLREEGRSFMIDYLTKDIEDKEITDALTKNVIKDEKYSLQSRDESNNNWYPNIRMKTIYYKDKEGIAGNWEDKNFKSITYNEKNDSRSDPFYIRDWKDQWTSVDPEPPT